MVSGRPNAVEKRHHLRTSLVLAITLDGPARSVRGVTRDMSPTGLFVVLDEPVALQGHVCCRLEVPVDVCGRAGVVMSCLGSVLRTEILDGQTRVAVRVTDVALEVQPNAA